jgi:hypothetical protein
MLTFGAKLGFALHYETHGTPVPPGDGVQPFYFTNASAARGEMPCEIIDRLPGRRALQQGSKHVSDQFTFSSILTDERRHAVFYAVFNQSFAIMSITAQDCAGFLKRHADEHPIFRLEQLGTVVLPDASSSLL